MISPSGSDDMSFYQQKLFQQRQLLLKRRRDSSRNSFGVVAQHDAALMAQFRQKGDGPDACGVEKLSLVDDALVTIVVPEVPLDETMERRTGSAIATCVALQQSVACETRQESGRCLPAVLPTCTTLGTDSQDRKDIEKLPCAETLAALKRWQALSAGHRSPDELTGGVCFSEALAGKGSSTPTTHPELPRQSSNPTVTLSRSLHSLALLDGEPPKNPRKVPWAKALEAVGIALLNDEPPRIEEKTRGRKLWKPWVASKRGHIQKCATELPQEPIQAIREEPRVSISCDASVSCSGDRPRLAPLCRAGTPWQAPSQDCADDALDISIGSDLSSIPGLVEEEVSNKVGDDAFETDYASSALDESGDSDVEDMVCRWKVEEATKSPSKTRFERLKGLLPSKLRQDSTSPSQTPVQALALELNHMS
jgi:hypothetical protein